MGDTQDRLNRNIFLKIGKIRNFSESSENREYIEERVCMDNIRNIGKITIIGGKQNIGKL